jgi:hypothetical protein
MIAVDQQLYELKNIASRAPAIYKRDVRKTQSTEKQKEREDRSYYHYAQKGYIMRDCPEVRVEIKRTV